MTHEETPEERFTKIENLLSTVAEHQAQLANHQVHMAERQDHFADDHARHDNDIRELLEIQKRVDLAILKMTEAHHASEEKLNALIGTVDRTIGRQDDNPSQTNRKSSKIAAESCLSPLTVHQGGVQARP